MSAEREAATVGLNRLLGLALGHTREVLTCVSYQWLKGFNNLAIKMRQRRCSMSSWRS